MKFSATSFQLAEMLYSSRRSSRPLFEAKAGEARWKVAELVEQGGASSLRHTKIRNPHCSHAHRVEAVVGLVQRLGTRSCRRSPR